MAHVCFWLVDTSLLQSSAEDRLWWSKKKNEYFQKHLKRSNYFVLERVFRDHTVAVLLDVRLVVGNVDWPTEISRRIKHGSHSKNHEHYWSAYICPSLISLKLDHQIISFICVFICRRRHSCLDVDRMCLVDVCSVDCRRLPLHRLRDVFRFLLFRFIPLSTRRRSAVRRIPHGSQCGLFQLCKSCCQRFTGARCCQGIYTESSCSNVLFSVMI